MRGKLTLVVFFSIFATVGIGLLFVGVIPSLTEAHAMKRWYGTPAIVTSAKLEAVSEDNSTSYKAVASYTYQFNDRQYQGNRVSIGSGSDNVGDYQQNTASGLMQALKNDEAITVWVNPVSPSQSIIDRNIRWEMLAIYMLFVLVFGGVGIIGLFIVLFKSTTFKTPEDISDKPWLLEKRWASSTIYSDGKTSMWFLWGFAIFWNLLSSPLIYAIPKEVSKGNHMALIGVLFPLVGIGLLIASVYKTMQWRRFGNTPLYMDPYPGAIGGHVGGYVDVPIEYDLNIAFTVSIQLIQSYVSGSGSNRSRGERIKWQDNGIANTEGQLHTTRVWIRFNVPEGMQESQPIADSYHLWRLTITAGMPGVDFSRSYEIPVFATGKVSAYVKQDTTETAASIEHKYQAIEALIDPIQVNGGIEWKQPVGRNVGMSIGLIVFGGIFTGAGFFLSVANGIFISIIFLSIGSLVVACGLYTFLNSLWVRVDAQSIFRKRCILGLPVSSQVIDRHDVSQVCVEQGVISGSTVYYNVLVKTAVGKKYCIAEGFKGESEANLAKESLDMFIRQ